MAGRQESWLVRYVSPFGSPAWMPEAEAKGHLEADDADWVEWSRLGLLDERMRRVGPPRIEYPKEDRH